MIALDPRGSAKRRRLATLVLVAGGALVAVTFAKDYPREQELVFRIDDPTATALTASITKVGEAEARMGFTLALPPDRLRDVSHTVRLPNGEYVVTVELGRPRSPEETGIRARPKARPEETSVAKRVILSGSEVVVRVEPRVE